MYFKVLTGPYNEGYKWWLSVDFAKRLITLLTITTFTRNNVSNCLVIYY